MYTKIKAELFLTPLITLIVTNDYSSYSSVLSIVYVSPL